MGVGGAVVDPELADLRAPEAVLREHPADGETHDPLGLAAQEVFERLRGQTAGVPRVTVVPLVGELAGAEVELGHVDHDHVVTRVDVRGIDRLVLAAQQRGGLGGHLAEDLALGVDDVPGALDVGGFRRERAQLILTKVFEGVDRHGGVEREGTI